jgi:hypothetical protein
MSLQIASCVYLASSALWASAAPFYGFRIDRDSGLASVTPPLRDLPKLLEITLYA